MGDGFAKFFGVAVAFGDEDVAGAREVGRGFAQGAAREEMFVAERLLVIDQNDVAAAAEEFPVLKAVVEKNAVAALFARGERALISIAADDHRDVQVAQRR